MMVTTHILIGALIGAVVAQTVPHYTTIAVLAGLTGGVFPDLDMLLDHRRTLHFPVYFPLLSLTTGLLFLLWHSGLVFGLSVFFTAASIHSVMDIFSGGRELRPWEKSDNRAVFNHYSSKWIRARRVVYSGSLGDFMIGFCTITVLFLF